MSSRRQLSIVAKGACTNFLCVSNTLVECMRRRPPRARRIANNTQKYTSRKERLSRFSDAHWTWVIIGRACGDAKLGNRAARGEVTRELNNNVYSFIFRTHTPKETDADLNHPSPMWVNQWVALFYLNILPYPMTQLLFVKDIFDLWDNDITSTELFLF